MIISIVRVLQCEQNNHNFQVYSSDSLHHSFPFIGFRWPVAPHVSINEIKGCRIYIWQLGHLLRQLHCSACKGRYQIHTVLSFLSNTIQVSRFTLWTKTWCFPLVGNLVGGFNLMLQFGSFKCIQVLQVGILNN